MSRFAVLALYPLWAVALLVATTTLRLGRASRLGLLSLCFSLAFWVTGLILLENPGTAELAERVVPAGMFLAAAFIHAGADVVGLRRRAIVWLAYLASAALVALCAASPRLLYGPGARGAGPIFVPLAIVSALAGASLFLWLARAALAARGGDRRRLVAITLACLLGSLGCGGVVALRVLGLGDVGAAAPLLLPAVALAAYAVLSAEEGARAASSSRASLTPCSPRRSRRSGSRCSSSSCPRSPRAPAARSRGSCSSCSSPRSRSIPCAFSSSTRPAGSSSPTPSACAISPIGSSAPRSAPITPSASPRSAASPARWRTRSGTRSA